MNREQQRLAPKGVGMTEKKERAAMYFITVVRIFTAEEMERRRPNYTAKTRILGTLRHAIKRTRKEKTGWKGFVENLKEIWHEYDEWPVTHRTWGYFADRETAIKAVEQNWTDMYEYYYTYAVIEKIPEGICGFEIWVPDESDDERQIFFKWDKAGQKYRRVDAPPQPLVDVYNKHHICFQFADLG